VETQEILALLLVASVVAVALWRRRRRRQVAGGCGQCGDKPAASKEAPIRFYRRRS
jgi:hypothetical protein